jgi:hypothetical protein
LGCTVYVRGRKHRSVASSGTIRHGDLAQRAKNRNFFENSSLKVAGQHCSAAPLFIKEALTLAAFSKDWFLDDQNHLY